MGRTIMRTPYFRKRTDLYWLRGRTSAIEGRWLCGSNTFRLLGVKEMISQPPPPQKNNTDLHYILFNSVSQSQCQTAIWYILIIIVVICNFVLAMNIAEILITWIKISSTQIYLNFFEGYGLVFNAIFSNISVLLVEETGKNYRSAESNLQTLSHNVVSSTPRHERGSNSERQCW